MRLLIEKWMGVAVYLAAVTGLCIVCTGLTHHVAKQAITLAALYLPEASPREPTLVERRQIDAAQSDRLPAGGDAGSNSIVLTMPATSPQVMAAQLDLAEREDLIDTRAAPRPVRSSKRRAAPRSLTAAEVFGRRFGVLTVASR